MSQQIDHYVLTAESIIRGKAGLFDFMTYLKDKNHKNHEGKTKRIVLLIGDTEKFFERAVKEYNDAEFEKIKNRVGGRPSKSYAYSFTLNFPYTIKPNDTQLQKILRLVYEDMAIFLSKPSKAPKMTPLTAEELNKKGITAEEQLKRFQATQRRYERDIADFKPVSYEELRDMSIAALHDQENPHIHLTFPIFRNGKSFQALKANSFTSFMKTSFTKRTDEVMGSNFKNYQVSSNYNKSYSMATLKQDKKAIDESIDLLRDMIEYLQSQDQDDKLLQSALDDLDKGKTIKAQKKLDKYKNARDL